MSAFNKPFMNVTNAELQFFLLKVFVGLQMYWKELFPVKYTKTFDLKGIEGKDGIPVSADRVAFNAKAPKKTRKKLGSWSGQLGKISMSKEKDEIEINDYRDSVVLATANPQDQALKNDIIATIYDDVKACADGIDAKIELDAMRIACMGKQVYSQQVDGDMVTADEIDFNIPEENKKGAKVAWASYSNGQWTPNASADGLKDIIDASRTMVKNGKRKPQFVYMEQTAFDWLCGQTATANKLYPTAQSGVVTSDMITIDAINAYLSRKSAPKIYVLDTNVAVEHKDGSIETIKPWEENLVVMSPVKELGYTYYKPVPMVEGTDAVQVQNDYFKMTRYSEVNPMLEVTMSEAYIQPALANRNSLCYMNVAKTSWADGSKD